jgi:hypothetical protein
MTALTVHLCGVIVEESLWVGMAAVAGFAAQTVAVIPGQGQPVCVGCRGDIAAPGDLVAPGDMAFRTGVVEPFGIHVDIEFFIRLKQ